MKTVVGRPGFRRAAIAVAFGLAIITAYVQTRPGKDAEPLPGPPLRVLGQDTGRKIGTAVRAEPFRTDRAYRQVVAAEFSSVTPENEMKWDALQPERGKFAFGPADYIIDVAADSQQDVRGHTLVWHNQLPGWVRKLGPRGLDRAMREHIRRVAGHFAGKVAAWDVVNEALTDTGRLRPSVFLRRLGASYISRAFRAARSADPAARLYINDFGIEGINRKSDRLYRLVRDLKRRGVPIDGVGFQMHVNLKGVPGSYRENLRRFAGLGLELSITEADVALPLPPTARREREQARVITDAVRGCLAVPPCRSFTFWGFTDSRSWISETRPGQGAATLLDAKLRAKPAYKAVQRALRP